MRRAEEQRKKTFVLGQARRGRDSIDPAAAKGHVGYDRVACHLQRRGKKPNCVHASLKKTTVTTRIAVAERTRL